MTIEDADDEDDNKEGARFAEEYPERAGAPINATVSPTPFDELAKTYPAETQNFGPFRDEDEWEFGVWNALNVGHGKTNSLLNLKFVSRVF